MIQPSSLRQYTPQSPHMRRMRIARLVAESVMLSMYCYPLLGNHACGEPQPKPHGMRQQWVKYQSLMCHTTMQIQGNAYYGNVCHHQGGNKWAHQLLMRPGWFWQIQLVPLFICDWPPMGINGNRGAHFYTRSRLLTRQQKIHKLHQMLFSYDSFCSSIIVLTCESFHVCDALWAVSNYVRFYQRSRSNCQQPTLKQFR